MKKKEKEKKNSKNLKDGLNFCKININKIIIIIIYIYIINKKNKNIIVKKIIKIFLKNESTPEKKFKFTIFNFFKFDNK